MLLSGGFGGTSTTVRPSKLCNASKANQPNQTKLKPNPPTYRSINTIPPHTQPPLQKKALLPCFANSLNHVLPYQSIYYAEIA
jgi:hypothetical protein